MVWKLALLLAPLGMRYWSRVEAVMNEGNTIQEWIVFPSESLIETCG